ncbi:hypothetical protein NM208_g4669 [Fusarium decemcellulare]|uniref:Uncharacterized protein n=1 Tax=Fusarium decemcellulare TaxID=57161 RepID=A0ACC1SJU5_9HYPO|nr:hypothetical protein NM208_g4669 [Fusarium decemcellulare]
MARIFGDLVQRGWRPLRNIEFVSDAEDDTFTQVPYSSTSTKLEPISIRLVVELPGRNVGDSPEHYQRMFQIPPACSACQPQKWLYGRRCQARAFGNFANGHNPFQFAGLLQPEGSDLVTFRDVIDKLRLCFELPDAVCRNKRDDADSNSNSWDDISFALTSRPNTLGSAQAIPSFVAEPDRDQPVPSLPPRAPKQPNIIKYHLVRHKRCSLSTDAPLTEHLRGSSNQATQNAHSMFPILSAVAILRYLPPKKVPSDPKYATMPLRRQLKPRSGSQSPPKSPPKRRTSGSVSPTKDGLDDANGQDPSMMIAPSSLKIDLETAKKGDSWVVSPAMGPALQACHIVPQHHYHLYPIIQSEEDDADRDVADSPRRLQEAWHQTWNAKNGILLLSHLHELFDARLISIHPDTYRIRSFVPYNVLTKYNGQEATIPPNVDRNALRYHYDMCCIENMAAEMPLLTLSTGTTTPLSARTDLLMTPGSAMGSQFDAGVGRAGDPTKRSRPSPGPGQAREVLGQDTMDSQEASILRHERLNETDATSCKRRRLHDYKDDGTHSPQDWLQDDVLDSYITPFNSRAFLADVNWELQKFKARHPCE